MSLQKGVKAVYSIVSLGGSVTSEADVAITPELYVGHDGHRFQTAGYSGPYEYDCTRTHNDPHGSARMKSQGYTTVSGLQLVR